MLRRVGSLPAFSAVREEARRKIDGKGWVG